MAFEKIPIQMPKEELADRELEVLTYTAYGKTRSEIASILNLSDETIKVYVERACHKLNVVNKTQAATVAITLGLIAPYRIVNTKK